MFEYQGWATIRESYLEEFESEKLLVDIVSKIKKVIKNIDDKPQVIGLRHINGVPRLWIMGFSNHKGNDWNQAYDLFTMIASTAPGSYGVLSYRDDEDQNGNDNSINMYVLKKGQLSFHQDPFLSPCIPSIEE